MHTQRVEGVRKNIDKQNRTHMLCKHRQRLFFFP